MEDVYAKDIESCDTCPLYGKDCPGGWTSGAGGTPIEPPCTSWENDTLVFEGMYADNENRGYSEQEMAWFRQEQAEREERERKEKHERDIEEAKRLIAQNSKYPNAKLRRSEWHDGDDWFCPECHRWCHPWAISYTQGIAATSCPRCGAGLAHSWLLEEEQNQR